MVIYIIYLPNNTPYMDYEFALSIYCFYRDLNKIIHTEINTWPCVSIRLNCIN